jgi:hypothetical protein
MSASLKWRDKNDMVHSVEEWITWSFNVIDREFYEDADDDDQQSMGRSTLQTSCGIKVPREETFGGKKDVVSCLYCLSSVKES